MIHDQRSASQQLRQNMWRVTQCYVGEHHVPEARSLQVKIAAEPMIHVGIAGEKALVLSLEKMTELQACLAEEQTPLIMAVRLDGQHGLKSNLIRDHYDAADAYKSQIFFQLEGKPKSAEAVRQLTCDIKEKVTNDKLKLCLDGRGESEKCVRPAARFEIALSLPGMAFFVNGSSARWSPVCMGSTVYLFRSLTPPPPSSSLPPPFSGA